MKVKNSWHQKISELMEGANLQDDVWSNIGEWSFGIKRMEKGKRSS